MLKNHIFLVHFALSAALASSAEISPINPVYTYEITKTALTDSTLLIAGIENDRQDPNFFFSAITSGQITKWKRGLKTPIWQNSVSTAGSAYTETLTISRDGLLLAAAGSQGLITLVDAVGGRVLPEKFTTSASYQLPVKPTFTSIAFSGDGTLLAAGDSNGLIHIWTLGRQDAVAILGSVSEPIRDIMFAEDSRFLVATNAKDVLIWNLELQKVVANLNEDLATGTYKFEDAFLPDYERYLVITTVKETLVYDISAQKTVRRFQTNPAIQRDSDDSSRYGPLLTVSDARLSTLFRFHKSPYIEELDFESGNVKSTYKQSSAGGLMNFGPYFTSVTVTAAECGNFLVGTQRFGVNLLRGTIDNIIELNEYQLPCR